MSRVKLIVLSALTVAMVSAVASASASAFEYQVNEAAVVAAQKIEGTSGVSLLESEILGVKVIIECKKDTTLGELLKEGKSVGEIKFTECKLFEITKSPKFKKVALTACTITEPIVAKFTDQLEGDPKEKFTGSGGAAGEEIFAEITIGVCALKGTYKAKGAVQCGLPESEVEEAEHEIDCTNGSTKAGGYTLTLGGKEAKFQSHEKIKLVAGGNFSAH